MASATELRPWQALALAGTATVLANASWFSATAVVPALTQEWGLGSGGAAWLVIVVQLGFVLGSVVVAMFNLADRVQPRRLIAIAAIAAGVANSAMLLADGLTVALAARFLVGVALSGVYAPAVRLVATYFARGRGLATGVVVGALTLGSGSPNLVRGIGHVPWQATIAVTTGLALIAAVVISPVRVGPGGVASPPLDLVAAARALRLQRPVRLVTLGYLGHMWELYALWAWLATFFAASRLERTGTAPSTVQTGATVFVAIGVAGLIGSVLAGGLADRLGRTTITSAAMLLSAGCCLVSPLAFAAGTPMLVAVLMVWGASVIADSAQFSAAATELAEPRYAGSVLALQLALGFALTIISIRLVPIIANITGWRFALLPLAVGPLLGTVAMLRLRALPAARQLAHGNR